MMLVVQFSGKLHSVERSLLLYYLCKTVNDGHEAKLCTRKLGTKCGVHQQALICRGLRGCPTRIASPECTRLCSTVLSHMKAIRINRFTDHLDPLVRKS